MATIQESGQQHQPQYHYQINASKMVKGHKLRMKDLIKKYQLKNRGSLPQRVLKEKNSQFVPRFNEYTQKYKGLQSIEDGQDLKNFIAYQREKQSRQSARGIKLFSCPRSNNSTIDDTGPNNCITLPERKAKTSQSQRNKNSSLDNNSKTLSHNLNGDKSQICTPKLEFSSQNLGKRMNEYLNIILRKKGKSELEIRQNQLKEQSLMYQLKVQLANQQRIITTNQKMKTNNFYRQMKKYQKRIQSAKCTIDDGSNQLVKSLAKRTVRVSNRTTQQSWRPSNNSYYSIDVRDVSKTSRSIKTPQSQYKSFRQMSAQTLSNLISPIPTKR